MPLGTLHSHSVLTIVWAWDALYHLNRVSPLVVWVYEYGIWPSSEHLHLFKRWRDSALGREYQTDTECLGYEFEPDEFDDAVSCVMMALAFGWGIQVFSIAHGRLVSINHDGHIRACGPGTEKLVKLIGRDADRG